MRRYFLLLCIVISFVAEAQPPIPELWGVRIHDEAKVLSGGNSLEYQLKAFEDSTSNQIAILVIPTLDDYPIEEYALQVVEKWKLGQADKDNGILILAAINDRKVRIEVGEGLEGVLPDALCNQIIRNEMAPYFRQGNYDAGLQAAVLAIGNAIKGEYVAEKTSGGRNRRGGSLMPLFIIIVVLVIFSLFRGGRRGGGPGNRGGGWGGPIIFGGSGFGGGFGGGGGGGGFGGFSGGGGGFGGGGSSGSW